MLRRTLFGIVAVLLTWVGAADARLIPDWPYEKLVRESDLVILAVPEASADSGEPPAGAGWKAACAAVNTTFRVLAPLKGEVQGTKLTLVHYRLKDGFGLPNGPCLISFRIPPQAGTDRGGPCYLLFLRKGPDGRYEPVAGQEDSVLSVRDVSGTPWNSQSAEKK